MLNLIVCNTVNYTTLRYTDRLALRLLSSRSRCTFGRIDYNGSKAYTTSSSVYSIPTTRPVLSHVPASAHSVKKNPLFSLLSFLLDKILSACFLATPHYATTSMSKKNKSKARAKPKSTDESQSQHVSNAADATSSAGLANEVEKWSISESSTSQVNNDTSKYDTRDVTFPSGRLRVSPWVGRLIYGDDYLEATFPLLRLPPELLYVQKRLFVTRALAHTCPQTSNCFTYV